MPWLLMYLTFFPPLLGATPPAFDTLSILRFNTVCAHCHEGQCSGRLSFALSPEASFNHIRRYGGEVDDALARQLQALLAYMKRECAYAPLPAPDLHTPLERGSLDAYRDPASGHYFMPLGNLEPGKYRLSLRLESPGTLRVELLNAWFDFLIDECFGCERALLPLLLEVEEASRHYLRLRSPSALRLNAFSLSRETEDSRR